MNPNVKMVRLKKHNWFIRLFSKEKRREHKAWKGWEELHRLKQNEQIEVIPTKYEPSNLPPWYVLANYSYKNTKDTMSKHTQGTWITGYGYVDGIGEVFGVGIQTEPNWTPICILSLPEKVNETDVANARLITVAPEMLAVLNEAPVPSKYHGVRGFETNRFLGDYEAWMESRRAAIAKVEGE